MEELLLALQGAVLALNLLDRVVADLELANHAFTPQQIAAITEARHEVVRANALLGRIGNDSPDAPTG